MNVVGIHGVAVSTSIQAAQIRLLVAGDADLGECAAKVQLRLIDHRHRKDLDVRVVRQLHALHGLPCGGGERVAVEVHGQKLLAVVDGGVAVRHLLSNGLSRVGGVVGPVAEPLVHGGG